MLRSRAKLPTVIFMMIRLITLLWVFATSSVYPLQTDKTGPSSESWKSLLVAFERHEKEDHDFILATSKQNKDSLGKKLSEILLLEWNLFPDDPKLHQPRLVNAPKVQKVKGTIKGAVYVLNVEVDSEGGVLKSVFVQEPDREDLRNAIVSSVKNAAFRPAFRASRFVHGSGIITIRIEVL